MDYTLVHNSPCHEPQQNWCWCNKCQSLFYAEVSMGGPGGRRTRQDWQRQLQRGRTLMTYRLQGASAAGRGVE
jgi:hypothetical protein